MAVLLAAYLTVPVCAESRARRIWKASVAAVVASSAADIATSFNQNESNPIFRGPDGRFQARGFAIKAGCTAAVLGVEWLVVRRNPAYASTAAAGNFAITGVLGATTVHNLRSR